MMLRRSLLIAGIGLLPSLGHSGRARANGLSQEAAPHSITDAERLRIQAALTKDGYRLSGELRRKGALVSAVAEKDGASWRLVLDGTNGEIVGRRLMTAPAAISKSASVTN